MITCVGLSPSLDVTYRVEALRSGKIHRPIEVIVLPGGKSLNVARAATLLGAEVRAIGPLGGHTGARIEAGLAVAGVDLFAIPAEIETRACVTVFDEASGELTEFYEPAVTLSNEVMTQLCDSLKKVTTGWIAVSGSVPEGEDLVEFADVLAVAARRGVRVAIDTHGDALGSLLDLARPNLIKVNHCEAEGLLGPGTANDLARRLAQRLSEDGIAIVTDGTRGAVAVSSGQALHATPPTIGVHTVGSGDCFFAGLLAVLDTPGGSLSAALALGTAAASANTLAMGAAEFDSRVVEKLRGLVEVTISQVPKAE